MKWSGVISSHEISSELDSILTMISWIQRLPHTWTNSGHLWPMLRGWILCWTARGPPCDLEKSVVCSLNVLWELGQQTINNCQYCQRLVWPLWHCICWHRLEGIFEGPCVTIRRLILDRATLHKNFQYAQLAHKHSYIPTLSCLLFADVKDTL